MAGLINITSGANGGLPGLTVLPTPGSPLVSVGVGGAGTVNVGGSGTGSSGTGAAGSVGSTVSGVGSTVSDVASTLPTVTVGVDAYAPALGATGAVIDPALHIDLLGGLGTGAAVSVNTPVATLLAAIGTLPDTTTAYTNIFRLQSASEIPSATADQLHTLQGMVDSGQITQLQATMQIADGAAGFTSVAETSYAFFSGLTPTADGLTYLVHSPTNPADLSDAYYAGFNLENRYINFASNLGLHSDYAPGFAQDFGSLSFNQAVETAYDRIVGVADAQAAGINAQAAIADIESRQGYFAEVAQERFGNDNQDLATKLAAVAYIMEEAVKANVGHYGEANQNFLVDLADGNAQFHIDLVGTYGHGTAYDVS